MKPKSPLRVKVISMGDCEVGKTSLIKQYYEQSFNSKYLPTIGIDYGLMHDERRKDVIVNIFDFSGDPLYLEVRNDFYSHTQVALLVYDVTNYKSFKSLEGWVSEMYQEMTSAEFSHVVVIVCANKIDKLYRAVDSKEGRRWADMHSYPYFETSAKDGTGVQEVFEKLFNLVIHAKRQAPPTLQIPRLFTSSKPGEAEDSAKRGHILTMKSAIQQLLSGFTDFDKLGLPPSAKPHDVQKAYKRLAVLLHPDKCMDPGAEDAFKILVAAKNNIMRRFSKTGS